MPTFTEKHFYEDEKLLSDENVTSRLKVSFNMWIPRQQDLNNALSTAVLNRMPNATACLVSQGAKVNHDYLIAKAVNNNDLATLKALFLNPKDIPRLDVAHNNNADCIPLHLAIKGGNPEIVAFLVEKGTDIIKYDSFYHAIINDQGHLVPVLLVNFKDKGGAENQKTLHRALCWACSKKHEVAITALLPYVVDPAAKLSNGSGPIDYVRNNSYLYDLVSDAMTKAREKRLKNGNPHTLSLAIDIEEAFNLAAADGDVERLKVLIPKLSKSQKFRVLANALRFSISKNKSAAIALLLPVVAIYDLKSGDSKSKKLEDYALKEHKQAIKELVEKQITERNLKHDYLYHEEKHLKENIIAPETALQLKRLAARKLLKEEEKNDSFSKPKISNSVTPGVELPVHSPTAPIPEVVETKCPLDALVNTTDRKKPGNNTNAAKLAEIIINLSFDELRLVKKEVLAKALAVIIVEEVNQTILPMNESQWAEEKDEAKKLSRTAPNFAKVFEFLITKNHAYHLLATEWQKGNIPLHAAAAGVNPRISVLIIKRLLTICPYQQLYQANSKPRKLKFNKKTKANKELLALETAKKQVQFADYAEYVDIRNENGLSGKGVHTDEALAERMAQRVCAKRSLSNFLAGADNGARKTANDVPYQVTWQEECVCYAKITEGSFEFFGQPNQHRNLLLKLTEKTSRENDTAAVFNRLLGEYQQWTHYIKKWQPTRWENLQRELVLVSPKDIVESKHDSVSKVVSQLSLQADSVDKSKENNHSHPANLNFSAAPVEIIMQRSVADSADEKNLNVTSIASNTV